MHRQSFVNFDPHLVVGTVFFLASKVEESQLSLTTVASVLHHYTTSTYPHQGLGLHRHQLT
jgi:cbb3-type cytochrome oxidase subunit 1